MCTLDYTKICIVDIYMCLLFLYFSLSLVCAVNKLFAKLHIRNFIVCGRTFFIKTVNKAYRITSKCIKYTWGYSSTDRLANGANTLLYKQQKIYKN